MKNKTVTIDDWIDALESGEYQQAQETLCHYNGVQHKFCCLGVLCDLKGAIWKDKESSNSKQADMGSYVCDSDSYPLFLISDILGIEDPSVSETKPTEREIEGSNYSSKSYQIAHRLATANDYNKPFKDIATALRYYKEYKELPQVI